MTPIASLNCLTVAIGYGGYDLFASFEQPMEAAVREELDSFLEGALNTRSACLPQSECRVLTHLR